jgi:hypothetical protein
MITYIELKTPKSIDTKTVKTQLQKALKDYDSKDKESKIKYKVMFDITEKENIALNKKWESLKNKLSSKYNTDLRKKRKKAKKNIKK